MTDPTKASQADWFRACRVWEKYHNRAQVAIHACRELACGQERELIDAEAVVGPRTSERTTTQPMMRKRA